LLAAERKSVVKLASTPTARNLIRVYFLQERLKGIGGKDHGIARVHVVGAGVMGGDIAAWSAYKGSKSPSPIANNASSTRAWRARRNCSPSA
jgi:3-hydroxyacyl-CoA dehydrogenase/enoyl-CoA hydratase/3-hydroxybutyryl-CoA epimerase